MSISNPGLSLKKNMCREFNNSVKSFVDFRNITNLGSTGYVCHPVSYTFALFAKLWH